MHAPRASAVAALRARLFAALGLPLVALGAARCRTSAGGASHGGGASGGVPTAASQGSVEYRRTRIDDATWQVQEVRPPRPEGAYIAPPGECPNGLFCTTAPTPRPQRESVATTPVPQEFARCPASAEPPASLHVPAYGYVRLHEDTTRREAALRAGACCYRWDIPCPGGRPLHEPASGAAHTAPLRARGDWLAAPAHAAPREGSAELLAHAASHWRSEAAFEHASIAAFARLSLALLAHGAPAELLEGCARAGLDEVTHARDAFALALRFDPSGGEQGPGALALSAAACAVPDRAGLAVEALRDGLANEGTAAALAAHLARRCEDAPAREALERVADDEARHAELALRTLRWLLATDTGAVRSALLAERASLVLALATATHARAAHATSPEDVGALVRWGVPSASDRARVREEALRELVLPALDALLREASA